MPYVTQNRRTALDEDAAPQNAGELNYCLTWHLLHTENLDDLYSALEKEITEYIAARDPNYALYNEVVGALECCRREFVRRDGIDTRAGLLRYDALRVTLDNLYDRIIAPYEDTKINQNGDCY